ncbi:hypothetical protein VPH35_090249 [Triticum aestivum]
MPLEHQHKRSTPAPLPHIWWFLWLPPWRLRRWVTNLLHCTSWPICTSINEVVARLNLEDTKGRIPIDLLSGPVPQANVDSPNSVGTEVFSWGSGPNYQLGTGNAHIQKVFY